MIDAQVLLATFPNLTIGTNELFDIQRLDIGARPLTLVSVGTGSNDNGNFRAPNSVTTTSLTVQDARGATLNIPISTVTANLVVNFVGATSLSTVTTSPNGISSLPQFAVNRSSSATYYNSSGILTTAAVNAPRFDFDPSSPGCATNNSINQSISMST